MAKQRVIGFSDPKDFNDTRDSVADWKRRNHAGQAASPKAVAAPHIRWGRVVTTWADGDLNTVTIRPRYADDTAIPGIKTNGDHDLKIYIRWPADTDPGDMSEKLVADMLFPWVPFLVEIEDHVGILQAFVGDLNGDNKVAISDNDTTPNYLIEKLIVTADKWLKLTEVNDEGDEDLRIEHIGPVAGAVDTIGSAAEGNEAAETTTYDGTSSANGLDLYAMTRVAYFDAGNEILYGYVRKLTFDVNGHLQAVSGETRISIDVPEDCT